VLHQDEVTILEVAGPLRLGDDVEQFRALTGTSGWSASGTGN
jgi:hypothetical protein